MYKVGVKIMSAKLACTVDTNVLNLVLIFTMKLLGAFIATPP